MAEKTPNVAGPVTNRLAPGAATAAKGKGLPWDTAGTGANSRKADPKEMEKVPSGKAKVQAPDVKAKVSMDDAEEPGSGKRRPKAKAKVKSIKDLRDYISKMPK